MGIFLIILIIDLTTADKLDRRYLPPPGAKFSGGSSEDLQIPFEFPKGPKEATSKITTIVPDRGILTSGYYVGSTVEPNIGEIVDTISDSKSQETYFSNTSPATSYKYFPTAFLKDFFSQSTKRPLEVDQDIKNFDSQKHDTNPDYFVPNTQTTDTFLRISPDSVSSYQYSALNVPLFDAPITPTVSDNIKKYLNIIEGNPASVPQILNPQNQVMSHSKFNAPIYGRETIVTSTDNIQNLNSDFVPITNNIKKLKHVPNSKTIDYDFNSYKYPGNNKIDSTIPTSDIKPKLSTPETMISVPFIKSRLLSPKINTRIASGRIRQHPERPQADRNAVILNYHNIRTPNGYSYTYDTSNGISANESGTANNGVRAHGAYSYTGDDGKVYRVVYTADENGFLPRGDHIPPVPIAIRRLLEKTAREREAGIFDDGSYNEAKYGHTRYQGAMERYHPEFQGITNNAMNQLGDYSRKRFGGKGRPMNTIQELNQPEYKGKNHGIHELNDSIRYQVLPSNLGKGTKKLFENSLTRTTGSKKNTDDANESKKVHELFDQQNVNSFLIQGMTEPPDFANKQEQRLQNKPTNLAISTDYRPKKILPSKQNIPEIIETSNANVIENNKAFLANNEDGYFYITPQNKFIENGNQVKNKDRNLFTIDQELEIGDDDIITISVPSPNTFTRVDNEVLQTVSPYNRQYSLENLSPMKKNDNKGIDHSVNPNNATYNINLPIMSSDIDIQPKELISPANYEISMNPTGDTGDGKYANVQKPEGQTVFENGTPNVAVDEFARSATEDLRTPLKLYGQNPNISLSDFGHKFGIADSGNLETDADMNVSNTYAYEKGFESSKPINNYDPDRISKPTAKSIIGEDFTGPKRPQTFDHQNGYHY